MEKVKVVHEKPHCGKHALIDIFGWFLQALLATVAFLFLILKRECEPIWKRRSWLVWWFDTSKQALGAFVAHIANVSLSEYFQGDPCTWYITNILLDSTVGLLIVFAAIWVCHKIGRCDKWSFLKMGYYGTPPSQYVWAMQCGVYVGIVVIEKIVIVLLTKLSFWDEIKDMVLYPFGNPHIQKVMVIFLIPLVINIAIFWITDDILKRYAHICEKRENQAYEMVSRADE